MKLVASPMRAAQTAPTSEFVGPRGSVGQGLWSFAAGQGYGGLGVIMCVAKHP